MVTPRGADGKAYRRQGIVPKYAGKDPRISVQVRDGEVFVLGDPDGLRTLSALFDDLASLGETEHDFVHMYPGVDLEVESLPVTFGTLDLGDQSSR